MGYRGEDVPTAHGDWGRQQPWQPSQGAWDDGSQGYNGDDGYPGAGDGGYGYGPSGSYPAQGQQQYGPPDGAYNDPYAQQQPSYGGYGPEQGQRGYDNPREGYGYNPPPADYQPQQQQPQRQPQPRRPGPRYASGDGYPERNGGYGPPGGYPGPAADGYSSPRHGASGGYPALPPAGSGGYSAEDAGSDWYGGQSAAAGGPGFSDAGTYGFNGQRPGDEYGAGPAEYGTGARGVMRDPVRGYPPGPGQGSGPMPVPSRPALPAPPAAPRAGSPVAETRQQHRLDEPPTRVGRAPSGGFQGSPSASGSFQQAPSGGFRNAATGGSREAPSGGFPGSGGRDTFEGGNGYSDYDEFGDGFDQPGASADPYQDRFDGTGPRATGGHGAGRSQGAGKGPLSGKRLLYAAAAVVVVGIVGVAAWVFVLKPSTPASNTTAAPLPTGSAQSSQQMCAKSLGAYCHISNASDDPKALTVAELYPPAFTDDKTKRTSSLVSTKVDTKCGSAVIGQDLIKALQTGKCTQVVRGSYVSSDNKIMGTIGVVNLSTTNQAHYAGKVVGQNDFIAPLTSKKGVASKMGNGTGVVEAQFKGHYLILTWSEYVDGTTPKTKAQDTELEQFSNDLVSLTANIALSQRMVTGSPASTS